MHKVYTQHLIPAEDIPDDAVAISWIVQADAEDGIVNTVRFHKGDRGARQAYKKRPFQVDNPDLEVESWGWGQIDSMHRVYGYIV